jgi:hypothetical protein
MSQRKNDRRKALAVGLAVVGVAGLSLAAASQLSLSVEFNLQAGVQVLADCQASTVTVDFDKPSWAGGGFTVAGATLGSIDAACEGAEYDFVVADASGAALATASGTVTGATIDADFSAVNAASVAQVALTIYGG